MSTEAWKLEKNLCRCCHSEGEHKSLSCTDYAMGNEVVLYSDMLRICLNIELIPVDEGLAASADSICELCSVRLQDAYFFRQQVVKCEEQFHSLFNRHFTKVAPVEPEVKQEPPDLPDSNEAGELTREMDRLYKRNTKITDTDFDTSFDIVLQLKGKTKKEYKRKKRKQRNGAKKLKRLVTGEPNCKSGEPNCKSEEPNCESEEPNCESEEQNCKSEEPNCKSEEPKCKSEEPKCKSEEPKCRSNESNCDRTNELANSISNTTENKGPKTKRTPSYRLTDSDYVQTGSLLLCARCDRRFSSLSGLRFHVKSQHLDIFKYKCPECTKQFRTLAPYTKHKLESHAIDDRIKCNACAGVFNTRAQLVKHTNSFHMLGTRIRCELCDYECFSMEALYKHKFKHKTVKEHHCKFCNKAFLRKTTLDLHERIHTGDRRKVCAQCGQAFVQKASLNYHMAKYHPEVKF